VNGLAASVVTVGAFDGVHRGHRAVLDEIARRAGETGRTSLLVTFEPHPREILEPGAPPGRLTPHEERLEALAQSGVDRVAVLRFDERLRDLAPEAFVEDVLRAQFGMVELVVGANHGFGRGRAGSVATLRELGLARGFRVDVVAPVADPVAGSISSSRVRAAVAGGDLGLAATLLGRPYTMHGVVVAGAGRGRALGVPTANLDVPAAKLLPPDGVWAVRVEGPGGAWGGMLNQGPRPTVGDARRGVEVHLFGFAGDLYGARVRVEWVSRLRDVRRFPSLDALGAQLARDAAAAKAALARDDNGKTD
jgi:riboflavin kinase/FMN adenylyltransferase